MIIGIIAIARNFAIGKEGKLPWHYSADLRFFKDTTTGNAVAMGFHTWQSIGKPLPNRLNIILSRTEKLGDQSDVLLLRSTEQVIALSNYLKCDLFIIGGAKTYGNFADVIERWIVSEVPVTVEDADVFMPKSFLEGFETVETKTLQDKLKVKILQRRKSLL